MMLKGKMLQVSLLIFCLCLCLGTAYGNGEKSVAVNSNAIDIVETRSDGIYLDILRQGRAAGDTLWEEGFDDTTAFPAGWLIADIDGSGSSWAWRTGLDFGDGNTVDPAEPGGVAFLHSSWQNANGLTLNDWVVTPILYSVNEGDSLSFWAGSIGGDFHDSLRVMVATMDYDSVSAYTEIKYFKVDGDTTDSTTFGQWYNYACDLSPFAGEDIRVAIAHYHEDSFTHSDNVWLDRFTYTTGSEKDIWCEVSTPTPVIPHTGMNVDLDLTLTNRKLGPNQCELWLTMISPNGNENPIVNSKFPNFAPLQVLNKRTAAPVPPNRPAGTYTVRIYWVTVAGDTCWNGTTIEKLPAPCNFTVSPNEFSFTDESGSAELTVTNISTSLLDWTATIISPPLKTGARNNNTPRTVIPVRNFNWEKTQNPVASAPSPVRFSGSANRASVLYDQTGNPSGFGINCQNFETVNDPFDCSGADDFTIPTSDGDWTIDSVGVTGFYFNGAGPANDFDVVFYVDAGGSPGFPVETRANSAYIDNNGDFCIAMSPAVVLSPGTYWIGITANMDFATGGQWAWLEQTVQNGSGAHWQNPADGFASGCTTWGTITTCNGATDPDFSFQIKGTSSNVQACDWLSINPTTGTVTSGNSTEITVSYNSAGYSPGTYNCQIQVSCPDRTTNVDASLIVSAEGEAKLVLGNQSDLTLTPNEFDLSQNFPNPFNPTTNIEYALKEGTDVTIKIYNTLGQEVAVLVKEYQDAGFQSVQWDGRNAAGHKVASGVYIYRMSTGAGFVKARKLFLQK